MQPELNLTKLNVPEMTYNVSSGTLSLYTTTTNETKAWINAHGLDFRNFVRFS